MADEPNYIVEMQIDTFHHVCWMDWIELNLLFRPLYSFEKYYFAHILSQDTQIIIEQIIVHFVSRCREFGCVILVIYGLVLQE